MIVATPAEILPGLRSAEPVVTFDHAERLAELFGSPLLVLSRSRLAQTYQAFKENLPGVELFYAVKANPNIELLRTLAELGSSFDVCSYPELEQVLKAGGRTEGIIHTHPCKTETDLLRCYADGVRWFTFDSAAELHKCRRHAPDAKLLLRLGVSSASSLINLSAKFGATAGDAAELLRVSQEIGANVRGLSFHVGSQCLCPDDFHAALVQARQVWDVAADRGVQLEVLDIGGGFPAPYRQAVPQLDGYLAAVADSLEQLFGDVDVRIIAEPGRGMCAEAISLVTRVLGKSERGGVPWYILDDGLYGSFSGKIYDHCDYPLRVRGDEFRPVGPCVVSGPTCDSSDIIARDQELPDLEVGELVLVPTMGAYTSASASHFNGINPAGYVAVD
jgi:ornithine decarboxylase